MTANQINYLKAREEGRHNVRMEELSDEGNRINLINANTRMREADTSALVANLRSRELAETVRSNLAREAETQRSNMAREYENYRSNVEAQNEIRRANLASESIRTQQVYETQRANLVSEGLEQSRQAETERHNAASEQLSSSSTRAGVLSSLINTAGRLIGLVAR